MISFRTAGRRLTPQRTTDTKNRGLNRGFWLLTALAAAALFAFMPASALGANPSANLDQCANDPAPSPSTDGCDSAASQWVNGNLGASKSVYLEGDSIPYRMVFDNLSTSGTHKVTIEWDTTKSSKHAIDYIDNYNASVLDANPCLGITMVPVCNNLSPSSLFAIPADPQVLGAGVTPKPGNLTMWGGTITAVSRPTAIGSTTCTDANSSGPYCYSTGTGFSGDKSAAITVEFTATAANPVLAWGGHIASRADWGLTNSAVSIPGSPYHTRLIDLDGAGGNQDRSLSEGAVIFPGFIHVIKNTTGGDATFGYTASPTPLANFNITTVNGTGEQDFNNIIDFKTYTVTENSPPAHWAFDSLNCTVQSPNGGTQTINGMTAAIALKEGEEVTCTYANHHVVNSPTITTLLSSSSITVGGTVHDSSTISGATADAGGTVKYRYYSSLASCTDAANTFASPGGAGAGEKTVTAGVVPDSDAVQFNSAGTFYWRAWYSGDGNNNAASSVCSEEQLVVGKASPALSTNAGPNVTLGVNGTDLPDSATLTGATSDASGTITFHLYFGADCSAANEVAGSPVSFSPVAGDGTYVSPSIHVTKAGTYRWIANYGGDANNSATANTCNGTNENVVVSPRDTSLTTDAGGPFRLGENGTVDLHDTATLSGSASGAGGKITFTLYGPDPTPNSASSDDCTEGNVVGKVSNDNVDGDGNYQSPTITVNSPGVYHWVASYSGDDNNNGSDSLCGAEGENPLVIAPHISVVKSPDEQVIRSGDSVTWTIEVINDGSSTLTDVEVTDELAPGCARTSDDIPGLASMPPAPAEGSHVSYQCTRDNNTASFTNLAVATGTPEVGEKVSAEDSAHVTVIHPAITVSKTPHTQTVAFAGTVTFTIGVKNTGDSVLTDVHVTDAQAPGCARTKADIPQLASMAPGDELSYSCTVANVMANFTNVATATGTPPVGPDVSSTDSAAVTVGPPPPPATHPAISIVKNPKSQTVTTGGTATFTITVTNTGDVALTNVAVTDPLSPNCNRTIGTLNPGQSVSYTCTRPNVQASFNNVAVATGTAGDKTVSAQDTAPVTAKAPFKPKPVPKVVSHKKPKATG